MSVNHNLIALDDPNFLISNLIKLKALIKIPLLLIRCQDTCSGSLWGSPGKLHK